MSDHVPNEARVIPLRPAPARTTKPAGAAEASRHPATADAPARTPREPWPLHAPRPVPAVPPAKEPLWRDLVGDVLRRERLAQERTLKDVADAARISMPYLSELERGRKEASSEVLAAAARALGLGLTDLLSLAQRELTRHPVSGAVSGRGRSAPTSRYDGMCIAA
ncbi:helix-turn-helix transcriptional regulator [Streptomyces sp. NPDC005385]|uniref:helix-turn-helix domain-containing protein n=1 Tax=Streptomyces sp. NPDC005385 TaxID=3157039 RepID=UPI0033BC9D0E